MSLLLLQQKQLKQSLPLFRFGHILEVIIKHKTKSPNIRENRTIIKRHIVIHWRFELFLIGSKCKIRKQEIINILYILRVKLKQV